MDVVSEKQKELLSSALKILKRWLRVHCLIISSFCVIEDLAQELVTWSKIYLCIQTFILVSTYELGVLLSCQDLVS